ncbi:nucleotide exchange factor GrpE [Enterobacteriaceae endosymbiont of Macroplea mutica]|uniref:nucleotide exchange factor GrpE n=1 Tax=Enterobacteriaceae endosymbiont of Macroplea mutica TaxID=2675791 RepID=UPI001449AFB6|nr:nucleotide exchange factor GrpE [Enterobacteriaceae endosymbiont of Macroplea mutica]QJC31396.1 nucleotide exchange factor GrpE [Enterobacteriaceae endosymbiont of Macroplea mutica]
MKDINLNHTIFKNSITSICNRNSMNHNDETQQEPATTSSTNHNDETQQEPATTSSTNHNDETQQEPATTSSTNHNDETQQEPATTSSTNHNDETQQELKNQHEQDQFKILFLQNQIQELEKKNIHNKLRAQAEIDNIKKRSILDMEKTYKFSLEKIIIELLPIIDTLERAIILEKNNCSSKMIEGIALTLKLFIKTISKFGVMIINETNVPFDPLKHQAMSIVNTNNIQENYVIEIMQKGYMLHGRLLRPAMVSIVQKK